jgi:hypothetical protein
VAFRDDRFEFGKLSDVVTQRLGIGFGKTVSAITQIQVLGGSHLVDLSRRHETAFGLLMSRAWRLVFYGRLFGESALFGGTDSAVAATSPATARDSKQRSIPAPKLGR